jgi:hypothetical protein
MPSDPTLVPRAFKTPFLTWLGWSCTHSCMTKVLTLRMDAELLGKAEATAARLGLDRANYSRTLIENDLAEHSGGPLLRFAAEDLAGTVEASGISATNAADRKVVEKKEYTLVRLTDPQYAGLFEVAVPLRPDHGTMMRLQMTPGLIYSSNSRMYATLRDLFGESGRCFDDWKGSFSFPLMALFEFNQKPVICLLNLTNVRTSVNFGMMKLMPSDGRHNAKGALKTFFDDFPAEEISTFYISLVRFLTRHFEIMRKDYNEDFYHSVPSDLLIFGHNNGLFFDRMAKNQEDYNAAIAAL